MGLAPEKASRI